MIRIDTWAAYLDTVSRFEQWAFRGQPGPDLPLLPSLARRLVRHAPDRALWPLRERRAMRIFRRKAHVHVDDGAVLHDDLRVLAMMQHHGAATRLLDFTKSPFVAAFFALESSAGESVVYALNTPSLWGRSPSFDRGLRREVIDPRRPGHYERYFIDNRHPLVWFGEPSQETTHGYLSVLQALVHRHGAPLALYSDRHGIFTKADPEDPKPTQFERALLQLHIEPICAHSPQAKGRVERLFQTLQDRLCKAMRLEGIDTISQANSWLDEYLREHNRRFAVPAQDARDMHRPWPGSAQALADICSLHHQRQLSAQGACKFEGQILQLLPGQAHAPKARAMIDIAQHEDGTLRLSYRGKVLTHRSHALHEPHDLDQWVDVHRHGW